MGKIIKDRQLDEERALYNLTDAEVKNCAFEGPADGESALKEARNVRVTDCRFVLRYPLWHVNEFLLESSDFEDMSRAAIWYAENGVINDCRLGGIKALRECQHIKLNGCSVNSSEFGWKCDGITIEKSDITSEYVFFDSNNVALSNISLKGKYAFQYMENLDISDSYLDTKDAFWHSKNVTVRDSVVKGEYLGWYSHGLTLINCTIIGTQPLCYCKNLKLINCKTEECDLAFEYSDVEADISGGIDSIKNPRSGIITADHIGSIIKEDSVIECDCRINIKKG